MTDLFEAIASTLKQVIGKVERGGILESGPNVAPPQPQSYQDANQRRAPARQTFTTGPVQSQSRKVIGVSNNIGVRSPLPTTTIRQRLGGQGSTKITTAATGAESLQTKTATVATPYTNSVSVAPHVAVKPANPTGVYIEGHFYPDTFWNNFAGGQFSTLIGAGKAASLAKRAQAGIWYVVLLPQGQYDVTQVPGLDTGAGGKVVSAL